MASILGFDIGSSQLKIAYWNGSAVTKMVVENMPENMIKNDTIVSYDAMADFIKEVLKANGIKENKAALILPAQYAFLRRLSIPYMTAEQRAVNLPYEFREFLTENKDKYYYDSLVNEVINDENGNPKEMDIFASAVAKDVINEYRAMFHHAGLKLITGIPSEVPYINLLARSGVDKNYECAILDLGQMSSKLHIFTGQAFETSRVIDMGLKDVDLAIAESEGVDEHVANGYKFTNHNNCQSSDAARRVYAAVAADVRKTINFYGFSNRESNLREIYICGGGSLIPEFVNAIREASGLEVKDIADLLPRIKDDEDPSIFAQAIGATLQDTKPSDSNINVVIKEKAKIPVWKAAVGILVIAVAAGLFSHFCVYNRLKEVDEARAEVNRVQREHDKYVEYLKDYDKIAEDYAKYSQSWMNEQEKKRVDRDRIFEIIEEKLTPYCKVSEISISENVVSVDVTDCTLDEVSGFVDQILTEEDVSSVRMATAIADDVDLGLKSSTIIFTMKDRKEEKK